MTGADDLEANHLCGADHCPDKVSVRLWISRPEVPDEYYGGGRPYQLFYCLPHSPVAEADFGRDQETTAHVRVQIPQGPVLIMDLPVVIRAEHYPPAE